MADGMGVAKFDDPGGERDHVVVCCVNHVTPEWSQVDKRVGNRDQMDHKAIIMSGT